MTKDMRTITISERSRCKWLHIEAPGCIINITIGLHDSDGRPVTNVSVAADGYRYAGEPAWWVDAEPGATDRVFRIVRFDRDAA